MDKPVKMRTMSTINHFENARKLDKGVLWAFVLLGFGLLLVFFPFDILHNRKILWFSLNTSEYDKLGDFINGITSPFLSIAAFILLYLTYKSQSKELEQTRSILKKQTETIEKEQFESTFFNLLSFHHQIVNSIDLKKSRLGITSNGLDVKRDIVYGRDCFVTFYSGFSNTYSKHDLDMPNQTQSDNLGIIKKAYNEYYSKHQADLGHYFRNLYHLIKYIDKSNITNKQEYTSLVRAQLSSHEQLLLFYNCLSNLGTKFKLLVEKYSLFKNMSIDELISQKHIAFYEPCAFGRKPE